jgi:ankyrin repeat domain-containing protein 50
VQALLSSGLVGVNKRDKDGRTPLSFAAGYGYEEVVKILLDVEGIEVDSRDNDCGTSLSRAELYGRESIVRLLEEKLGR